MVGTMPHENRQTQLIAVEAHNPDARALGEAARILRSGGLVAFPTETVYGLGANALDTDAVARIFAAKGRPANNPVIVHVADVDSARRLAAHWPSAADRLVKAFWPGPLTIVVKKAEIVPGLVTAGGPTVALRMPAHPVARALIEAAGLPIAAPSANRSMRISATTAAHVLKGLAGRIDLVLDGGPTPGGVESTVVDLSAERPRLLRPGPVGAEQIEAALGIKIERCGPRAKHDAPLPSPGMLARHYAPNVPVECMATNASARVAELAGSGQRIGWVRLDHESGEIGPNVVVALMPGNPDGYAARLYAALHELEDAGVERIVVSLPPEIPRWAAIHDRLRRAASGPEENDAR